MATFLHTSALHTTHPELHPEPYGECTPWTGINGLAGTFNCHEWEPPSPRPFSRLAAGYPNHGEDVPIS
ncbi:hypothetical protein K0M31_018337, partial [Melipona bicolor]